MISTGYLLFLAVAAYFTYHFGTQMKMPKVITWSLANIFLPGIPLAVVIYLKFVRMPQLEAIKNGEPVPDSPLKPLSDWLATNAKPKLIELYKNFGINKDYVEGEEVKYKKKRKNLID